MNDTAAVLSAAPADHPSSLQPDPEALYRQHHARLLRAVQATVAAPAETIEDACSFAWLQLMRTDPEPGPRLFAWLRTVAIREAIRLTRRDAHFGHNEAEWQPDPRLPDVDTVIDAHDAVARLGSLRERQQRILLLHLAGYSYRLAERPWLSRCHWSKPAASRVNQTAQASGGAVHSGPKRQRSRWHNGACRSPPGGRPW